MTNSRAIHGEGLQPDIEVKITEEDLQAGRDPQLERAVEYLLDDGNLPPQTQGKQ